MLPPCPENLFTGPRAIGMFGGLFLHGPAIVRHKFKLNKGSWLRFVRFFRLVGKHGYPEEKNRNCLDEFAHSKLYLEEHEGDHQILREVNGKYRKRSRLKMERKVPHVELYLRHNGWPRTKAPAYGFSQLVVAKFNEHGN